MKEKKIWKQKNKEKENKKRWTKSTNQSEKNNEGDRMLQTNDSHFASKCDSSNQGTSLKPATGCLTQNRRNCPI